MELQEKREFAKILIARVGQDIDTCLGNAPDDWSGRELRQFIADRFSAEVGTMSTKQRANYTNTLLVTNGLQAS